MKDKQMQNDVDRELQALRPSPKFLQASLDQEARRKKLPEELLKAYHNDPLVQSIWGAYAYGLIKSKEEALIAMVDQMASRHCDMLGRLCEPVSQFSLMEPRSHTYECSVESDVSNIKS